eukprot:1976616-Alexandrium_andersonii.AAC.1
MAQPSPAGHVAQHSRDPGESLARSSRTNAATLRSARDSRTDATACHVRPCHIGANPSRRTMPDGRYRRYVGTEKPTWSAPCSDKTKAAGTARAAAIA